MGCWRGGGRGCARSAGQSQRQGSGVLSACQKPAPYVLLICSEKTVAAATAAMCAVRAHGQWVTGGWGGRWGRGWGGNGGGNARFIVGAASGAARPRRMEIVA